MAESGGFLSFLDDLFVPGGKGGSPVLPTMGDAPAMTPQQYALLGMAQALGPLAGYQNRRVGLGEVLGAAAGGMLQGRMAGARAAEAQEDRKIKQAYIKSQQAEMEAKTAGRKQQQEVIAALDPDFRLAAILNPEAVGKTLAEQGAKPDELKYFSWAAKYPQDSPERATLIGIAVKKAVEGGFRYGQDGAAAVPGGPADLRYVAGKAGAEMAGKLPFVGPTAAAEAGGKLPSQMALATHGANLDVNKAWMTPRERGPGSTEVAGGGPTGGAPVVTYQNPNPAPGTQQGKFEAGVGEQQAAIVKQWSEGAKSAAGLKREAGRIDDLMQKGFQTGWGVEARGAVANMLEGLGMSAEQAKGWTGVNPAQVAIFRQALADLVLKNIGGSLGTGVSNADRDFINGTLMKINDPIAATSAATQYLSQRAEQDLLKFDQGYAHVKSGGDPLQFEIDWNRKFGAAQQPGAAPAASPQRFRLDPTTGQLVPVR